MRYKSKIEKEQLGKHLEAIKQTTLISDFTIEKNSKGDGFNLIVTPGAGFFEDYDKFYLKHLEIDSDYHKDEERKKQEQPLRLVEKFYQNLYHRTDLSGMVILDKEIELAKKLLETNTPDEINDLILYTIDAAHREKFDIRSFSGVKVYLNAWIDQKETRAKLAALKQQQAEAEKERRHRIAYHEWWIEEVKRLRAATPPADIKAMEDEVSAQLSENHQNPLGFSIMVRVQTDALVAKRNNVLDYEHWNAKAS